MTLSFIESPSGCFAVCDGLGHGPEARSASNRAIEVLIENHNLHMEQLLITLNGKLTRTRGCAISIMRLRSVHSLEYVSAGNVCTHLYHIRDAHFFTPIPSVLAPANFESSASVWNGSP